MTSPVAIVDWDALLTVVWSSLAAGVGVTAAYGFAILGAAQAADLRAEGRLGEAAVFAVLAALGVATVLGAIVAGLVVLSD
jgi:hypothetical protein